MQAKTQNIIKRIVDAIMTVLLLCLMAYQVMGEVLHEWGGIAMTVLVIVHHILNRKWYGAVFKGKYNGYRIAVTAVNTLLLAAFVLTAVCGMAMSGHAVPFMCGILPVSFARRFHLAMSYWSFLLMGLHIGLHVRAMTAKLKLSERKKTVCTAVLAIIAAVGLYLFLSNDIFDYLLFRTPFAFFDYDKAGWLVFLENIAILLFWAFVGLQLSDLVQKKNEKVLFKPVLWLVGTIAAGIALSFASNIGNKEVASASSWQQPQAAVATASTAAETAITESTGGEVMPVSTVNDDYILINGGTFTMGSPESENWRISDEAQHIVSVSAFYIDKYETTQADYMRLMGDDPSTFIGDDLPVENISWLDAVRFANAKSIDEGLTPAYTISENSVSWNRAADGYRLPTEAEWEYACRAGMTTPFNTEHSLSADEADFYGHYPYEIEENYFDDSVLEARPGEYRGKTVAVGSFSPNRWGLYDCHGNVNEWCWDFYGEYNTENTADPTGAETGTRHIYRGGGWNDFAKNMRSAYRAAGQSDMKSYNLGVRLVRNAAAMSGIVTAAEGVRTSSGDKVLIAYFSWSGNTEGIAKEIQRQTGADIFEISPVKPYSSDYNTVLMEAQDDQHRNARPELDAHIPNMEEYDTILLGYPNWWASIPMPIATFIEEYDFSGKRIIPFCSHGGGRFGQSLTAIAKLAPDAVIGEGLSVHYSGGSAMPVDVTNWLNDNNVRTKE